MQRPVPRVIALHDLSGFGRGSLTSVIPLLSSLSVQVCPVPTAVLSAHTEFPGFSFFDMTDSMTAFLQHWKQLGLQFDAVYSGFLGSPGQAEIVQQFIEVFAPSDQLVLVDPAMADNGELYPGLPLEMVGAMRRLISSAGIITPNYTEACLLLGEKPRSAPTRQEVLALLRALADLGPSLVVVTNIPGAEENVRALYAYDKKNGQFWKIRSLFLPVDYPGTGDAFASILLGTLLRGEPLPAALDRAESFLSRTIRFSFEAGNFPANEGIFLEKTLPLLQEEMGDLPRTQGKTSLAVLLEEE